MFTVKRRFGNELWDIRQFVQPMTPGVLAITARFPADKQKFIEAAWAWVVNNIKYPPGPPEENDRHYREAYLPPALSREITYDYWNFPAETLALKVGDCEDASILLCSLLRNRLSAEEVFVTVGEFSGLGHAWVTVNGLVLETTPVPEAPAVYRALPEARPYVPLLRFNDQIVHAVAPGVADDLVSGRRKDRDIFRRIRGHHLGGGDWS